MSYRMVFGSVGSTAVGGQSAGVGLTGSTEGAGLADPFVTAPAIGHDPNARYGAVTIADRNHLGDITRKSVLWISSCADCWLQGYLGGYDAPIFPVLEHVVQDQMSRMGDLVDTISARKPVLPPAIFNGLHSIAYRHNEPTRYMILQGMSPLEIDEELLDTTRFGRLKTVSHLLCHIL
jgi:hypothetical protein